jgi:hypothetical protein
MQLHAIGRLSCLLLTLGAAALTAGEEIDGAPWRDQLIGRVEIDTIPFASDLRLRSATYTPSGKVLVSYFDKSAKDERDISLAVMDDDGANLRTFFSERIPDREKDNGIRFMVFPDNRRIFLGDFIIECVPNLDACDRPTLVPVVYPAEVAGGDDISHRWSEIIVAPDNQHIAWTTLFADYSAAVFSGKLEREQGGYTIVSPRMITSPEAFSADSKHPDGMIPNPVRNGEVKQFVRGGAAISMVGAKARDTADSVVLHLDGGEIEQITQTPGYNETTIFSPDERLGIVMSTRFSRLTDMAVVGLMPRPYPDSLNMGLNRFVYVYSVAGVRKSRSGNIGPALIDIEASKSQQGYLGVNLNTEDEWVYHSPMSWHPGGRKAMWLEGERGLGRHGGGTLRIQTVHLPDYRPAPTVAAVETPDDMPYASEDLAAVGELLRQGRDIDVKVYGRHSGHIEFRRDSTGTIEKIYTDFSDDGESVYNGSEKMQPNPRGHSTYTAKVRLSGPRPGVMDLVMTFGPLGGSLPAALVFEPDDDGVPLTHGYSEYEGKRLDVGGLVP